MKRSNGCVKKYIFPLFSVEKLLIKHSTSLIIDTLALSKSLRGKNLFFLWHTICVYEKGLLLIDLQP